MVETDLNLTVKDLAARYGVHSATIWRWVQRGHFPQPYQIAKGTTRWSASDVAEHEAQSKRPERQIA